MPNEIILGQSRKIRHTLCLVESLLLSPYKNVSNYLARFFAKNLLFLFLKIIMTFAILCAGAMEMLAYNLCFHTSLPNLHSRISYIYYQAWLYVWEGKTFSVWLSLALFNYFQIIFSKRFANSLQP